MLYYCKLGNSVCHLFVYPRTSHQNLPLYLQSVRNEVIQLAGPLTILITKCLIWNILVEKLRKRWRATAWCGKSKFAISSGWLKNGSLCHPDDIITLSQPIRMRYQFRLSRPDDIRWDDMSSGWHTAGSKSHPDEIRLGANSSGWLRVQMTLCHPDEIGEYRKSSGWHHTMPISHPDVILPIVKSSGWDTANS